MTTQLDVVGREYDALAGTRAGRHRVNAARLQRSDVVRHLVWAVVEVHWDDPSARPARRATATRGIETRLTDLVRSRWDEIAALEDSARRLSDAVRARLADAGHDVRPSDIGERVCTAAAARYRTDARPPDRTVLESTAAEVAAKVGEGAAAKLNREQFRALAREAYDLAWRQRGARSLVDFPPSTVELGPDVRPQLQAVKGSPVHQGIGWCRCVWSRYSLHFKASARGRSGDDPLDPRRPRPDPAARVDEEVERVCHPYGLTASQHRGALLALAHGLSLSDDPRDDLRPDGPGDPSALDALRRWESDLEGLLPPCPGDRASDVTPDLDTVRMVRARMTMWRLRGTGRDLEDRYGGLSTHHATVHRALSRKLWMDLHRREREYERPARRADLQRSLKSALDKFVPLAVAHPELVSDCEEPPRLPDRDGADRDGAALGGVRYQRTIDLLASRAADRVGRWHQDAAAGSTSFGAEYLLVLSRAEEPPEQHLTVDELAGHLRTTFGAYDA